ncbi:ABC transporter ATP-binding protein [Arthrobacter rhombi]|uniref:ABC transporter ATP-binding protein n=1 Tax=Arthrobacter rhombi TaxID=71253 RepID=UPI003FD6A72F
MDTTTAALELHDVRKTFSVDGGRLNAVDGISLRVDPGEIVALLGPNGAGKTTAIDMALGLTDPTSGSVGIFGSKPHEAVRAGRVSALLQTGGLLRDLSVHETVLAIASLYGAKNRVQEVMEATDITRLANRKVVKCSGGEQQRLKFALALLPDPDVLILDEPTAGMDVNARRAFWATMRQDATAGRTVIFATHYLEEAESFAQRIVLMNAGKIIADGTTANVRALASGRTVAATLQEHGTIASADPRLAELRALDGVTEVMVNGPRVTITATDSDAVAQYLLTRGGGTNLEISAPSLENAFVQMTNQPAPETAGA